TLDSAIDGEREPLLVADAVEDLLLVRARGLAAHSRHRGGEAAPRSILVGDSSAFVGIGGVHHVGNAEQPLGGGLAYADFDSLGSLNHSATPFLTPGGSWQAAGGRGLVDARDRLSEALGEVC